MLTPDQAAEIAEHVIVEYVLSIGCNNEKEIQNALEMLISKSARAIEKSTGNQAAQIILNRTSYKLAKQSEH